MEPNCSMTNETVSFDLSNNTDNTSTGLGNKNAAGIDELLSFKILNWLNIYYLGTIAIVGVLGNAFNFIKFLLNRRQLRSPSYYLASLALADVIFLLIIVILWLGQLGIDLYSWKGIYQTFFYLSSTSSCISGTTISLFNLKSKFKNYYYFCAATAWLVVAFTFERLIVVRYPLKRAQICTIRRAKIIIGFITLAALALQLIPLLTTTGIIKTTQIDCSKIKKNSALKNQCHSNAMYYQLMRVLNMLETFITVVVPPVLIVIMNLFIIHGLLKSREHFNGPEASTDLAVDHQVLNFISFHGEK